MLGLKFFALNDQAKGEILIRIAVVAFSSNFYAITIKMKARNLYDCKPLKLENIRKLDMLKIYFTCLPGVQQNLILLHPPSLKYHLQDNNIPVRS